MQSVYKLIMLLSFIIRLPLLIFFSIIGRVGVMMAMVAGRANFFLINTIPGVSVRPVEEATPQEVTN